MNDIFEQYGIPPIPPQTGDAAVDFFAAYPLDGLTRPARSAFEAPPAPPPPAAPLPPNDAPPLPGHTLEQVLLRLDELVGLKQIKSEFKRLAQFAHIQQARAQQQLTALPVPRHALFYSAPGGGKSTVALLYGQLLRALGVLSSGHVVETDRLGLATNFPAQTAERTHQAIERAAGGVLFVDDAHTLYKDDYATWDAGGEIIQILLETISRPNANFAVVLGGLHAPMQTLAQSHDGLKNLFATHMVFENYAPAELQAIFDRLCAANHYDLTVGARRKVGRLLAAKHAEQMDSFGNARYVFNLFQQIAHNQAQRLGAKPQPLDVGALRQLVAEDITPLDFLPARVRRSMGFDHASKDDDQ